MRRGLNSRLSLVLMVAIGSGLLLGFSGAGHAQSPTEVILVNIEFEGTKVWVPGPVVVKKGDTVRIKAINNVKSDPPVHGLAIQAYGIQELVNVGTPASIEFKADKAGIFPISCHLHPPHVGTQLVVLE
ncbi:MAG TPA: cupredoxin domain-containing protein [Candidatus Tectomicrobia bacterium]|nr:cupredoxin domain-containing protein [Candidatus Tectomicrobia bacterium]